MINTIETESSKRQVASEFPVQRAERMLKAPSRNPFDETAFAFGSRRGLIAEIEMPQFLR